MDTTSPFPAGTQAVDRMNLFQELPADEEEENAHYEDFFDPPSEEVGVGEEEEEEEDEEKSSQKPSLSTHEKRQLRVGCVCVCVRMCVVCMKSVPFCHSFRSK